MSTLAAALPSTSLRSTRARVHFATVAVVVTLASLILRSLLSAGQPLWLDETFTGAIAAEPSWSAVVHQIMLDTNAPLYPLLMHGWAMVFGVSNLSLRIPSLICGGLAPLLCLIPVGGITRRTRHAWFCLVALWTPAIFFSQDARCYALLLCLAIGSTLALVALLGEPTRRRATIWVSIATLAVLTHYHALVLVGLQGLVVLAVHRRRAVRLWPAALIVLPLVAWLLVHMGRIVAFSSPGATWYSLLRLDDLPDVLDYAFNSRGMLLVVAILVACAVRSHGKTGVKDGPPGIAVPGDRQHGAWLAAGAGLAGAVFIVTLAFIKPSFTPRYLVPFTPALLLGLALLAEKARASWPFAPGALVLVFAVSAASTVATTVASGSSSKIYTFERASQALIASGTKDLVFFFDNPTGAAASPEQFAIVGGFFFKRSGLDVRVMPLMETGGQDPNLRLTALADARRAAILWVYDLGVHDTAAKVFPPRLAALDPQRSCRNYGEAAIGIVACMPRQ